MDYPSCLTRIVANTDRFRAAIQGDAEEIRIQPRPRGEPDPSGDLDPCHSGRITPQQGPRILIFLAGSRCRGLVRNSPQGAKEVRGGVSEVCDRGTSGAILIIRTVNATRNGEYERDELRASNREGRPANLQGCGCGPGRDRPPRSSQNVVESADRIGDHPAGFGRPPVSPGGTSSDDSLQSVHSASV